MRDPRDDKSSHSVFFKIYLTYLWLFFDLMAIFRHFWPFSSAGLHWLIFICVLFPSNYQLTRYLSFPPNFSQYLILAHISSLHISSSGVLVVSQGDYFTNYRVTPVKQTWPLNMNVSVVELTDGTKNNFVHLKRLKMLKVKRGMCLPCFKTNIHDLCAWWKNEILYWHYMMV